MNYTVDTEFGNQMMKYLTAIQCIVMEPISLFFLFTCRKTTLVIILTDRGKWLSRQKLSLETSGFAATLKFNNIL